MAWGKTSPIDPKSETKRRLGEIMGREITDTVSDFEFEGVDFEYADFSGMTFEKVTFKNCRLTIDYQIIGREISKFDGWRKRVASFAETELKKVVFSGCDLREVSFKNAKLRDVSFMDCHQRKVAYAEVVECDEDGENEETREVPVTVYSGLNGASFKGAVLDGGSFVNSDLEDADFSHAHLRLVNFTNCKETEVAEYEKTCDRVKASFIGATVDIVNFVNSDLRESSFKGANFKNNSFINCNCEFADFSGVDISDSTFTLDSISLEQLATCVFSRQVETLIKSKFMVETAGGKSKFAKDLINYLSDIAYKVH